MTRTGAKSDSRATVTRLAASALCVLFLAIATPVAANHDQGNQRSQDHLHRGNHSRASGDDGGTSPNLGATDAVPSPAPSVLIAQVPAPPSLALFAIGAGIGLGAAALRTRGRSR